MLSEIITHPISTLGFKDLPRSFIVPENGIVDRLVLATPLFVQYASAKPLGLLGRWRMHHELARIHGVWGRSWQPQLSPIDQVRVYIPSAERGADLS
jgi:hypothetical protein